nr:unnamed protein product [Digitaria exilis]
MVAPAAGGSRSRGGGWCLEIARKLLDTNDEVILSSYDRHWSSLYELYSQIVVSTDDPSGRISRESTACLALMLSRVISGLKAMQSSPNLPSASASINSGFLLNIVSPGGRIGIENKEMLKTIEQNMPRYIQVLLEATGHLLQLLKEGLLDPSRVAGLLEGPVAKETLLDFLMIVSDLARMSKDFYVPIDKAGLVGFLKNYLSSEDPDIRGKACSAIGNMCRHSSYFYSPFEANKVIQLLVDRCSDPDKRTRKFACFAVGNAAYHNDMLYDELRGSIPQLTTLLLGPEEDKTKGNAAGALVTLSPSRRDALTESPLRIVLFALRKMCDHAICRNFLRSSELLPVIVHLRQSPDPTISEYASAIATRACQA